MGYGDTGRGRVVPLALPSGGLVWVSLTVAAGGCPQPAILVSCFRKLRAGYVTALPKPLAQAPETVECGRGYGLQEVESVYDCVARIDLLPHSYQAAGGRFLLGCTAVSGTSISPPGGTHASSLAPGTAGNGSDIPRRIIDFARSWPGQRSLFRHQAGATRLKGPGP